MRKKRKMYKADISIMCLSLAIVVFLIIGFNIPNFIGLDETISVTFKNGSRPGITYYPVLKRHLPPPESILWRGNKTC